MSVPQEEKEEKGGESFKKKKEQRKKKSVRYVSFARVKLELSNGTI